MMDHFFSGLMIRENIQPYYRYQSPNHDLKAMLHGAMFLATTTNVARQVARKIASCNMAFSLRSTGHFSGLHFRKARRARRKVTCDQALLLHHSLLKKKRRRRKKERKGKNRYRRLARLFLRRFETVPSENQASIFTAVS